MSVIVALFALAYAGVECRQQRGSSCVSVTLVMKQSCLAPGGRLGSWVDTAHEAWYNTYDWSYQLYLSSKTLSTAEAITIN